MRVAASLAFPFSIFNIPQVSLFFQGKKSVLPIKYC
nr:MAG TPA: hypothetical protein [Caudoviricetes sp.]DAH14718.1 MAG TPA: hypothetical protein [Caudoviricetes sp.]